MNNIDFLCNVLSDYCTLHNLKHIGTCRNSAEELIYESYHHDAKLTSEQEDWLSCYINVWDTIQEVN